MIKYILICSDKEKERKDYSIKQLHELGINDFLISEAQFPTEYHEELKKRKYIGNKKCNGLGKLGCYFAHEKAFELGYSLKNNFVVFEDDFLVIDKNFKKTLDDYNELMVKEDYFYIQFAGKAFRSNCCNLYNHNYIKDFIDFRKKYYGASDQILEKFCKNNDKKYLNVKNKIKIRKIESIICFYDKKGKK